MTPNVSLLLKYGGDNLSDKEKTNDSRTKDTNPYKSNKKGRRIAQKGLDSNKIEKL